ncbi:hypothetical protein JCM18918_1388 [Cutibacterium acnes JCM 18918]|nr:hypothetical protein JCM18918_1388 [Cutibacterium acnes JCM 18918]
MVRFGNDHTQATKVGVPTPQAYVADNDQAIGQLVETVSHSPIWKDTAIFLTEDDAQNGPDHVDAHRTIGEVISHIPALVGSIPPFTRQYRCCTQWRHSRYRSADPIRRLFYPDVRRLHR